MNRLRDKRSVLDLPIYVDMMAAEDLFSNKVEVTSVASFANPCSGSRWAAQHRSRHGPSVAQEWSGSYRWRIVVSRHTLVPNNAPI